MQYLQQKLNALEEAMKENKRLKESNEQLGSVAKRTWELQVLSDRLTWENVVLKTELQELKELYNFDLLKFKNRSLYFNSCSQTKLNIKKQIRNI